MVHAVASISVRDGWVTALRRPLDAARELGAIRVLVVVYVLLGYALAVVYEGSLVFMLLTAYGAVVQFMPLLVATLVNVADMRQSSDLGRIVSEQVSSRLTQLGYQTKEMKFRGSFLVRQGGGEFVLSRALRDISQKQDAQAVVAGVYAVGHDAVFVTLRMIRARDSAVKSGADQSIAWPDSL